MIDGLDGGGELPISCSLQHLFGESGLTWPALRMGSVLFLGVVLFRPSITFKNWIRLQVTREFRPLNLNLVYNPGWRVHSWVWRKSTTQRSDSVWAALQNSRFSSLALDVKVSSHSFLLDVSCQSVLYFSTAAAVENSCGVFDDLMGKVFYWIWSPVWWSIGGKASATIY